jgi:hypothetical protein
MLAFGGSALNALELLEQATTAYVSEPPCSAAVQAGTTGGSCDSTGGNEVVRRNDEADDAARSLRALSSLHGSHLGDDHPCQVRSDLVRSGRDRRRRVGVMRVARAAARQDRKGERGDAQDAPRHEAILRLLLSMQSSAFAKCDFHLPLARPASELSAAAAAVKARSAVPRRG